MSRQMMREIAVAASERWSEVADQVGEAAVRFKESRLYVQVVLSLVLLAVTALVALLPVGPLKRVREGLTWTATHDYDFAGQARRAQAWAQDRGGWGSVATQYWRSGTDRLHGWIERTRPVAQSGPNTPVPGVSPAGSQSNFKVNPQTGARFGWPVNGSVLYGFGWLPPEIGDAMHEGMDILAPVSSPVIAADKGTVIRTAFDPAMGYLIEIDHGDLVAVYAQVEEIQVRVGQTVQKGQALAVVAAPGGTEQEMPAHLHFEVRPAGKEERVDPAFYLGLGGSKL